MVMAFKGGDVSSGGHRKGTTSGFVGITIYLVEAKKNALDPYQRRDLAFGSNFDADDPFHAAELMRLNAALNSRVETPVYHVGFSLPKDSETNQGLETLTPIQWEAVADRAVLELGLEAHQVYWILHHDDGHQHIHLIANRVPLGGGKAWRPDHDYRRLENVARWTEKTFGLKVYQSPERGRRQGRDAPQLLEPSRELDISWNLTTRQEREPREPAPVRAETETETDFDNRFTPSYLPPSLYSNAPDSGGEAPLYGEAPGVFQASDSLDSGPPGEFVSERELAKRLRSFGPWNDFSPHEDRVPDDIYDSHDESTDFDPLLNFFPSEYQQYRRDQRSAGGSGRPGMRWGPKAGSDPCRDRRDRPTKRSDKEFRAIRASKKLTFWDDTAPAFRQALSWRDLGERLAAQGFHIEPAGTHTGGLVLCYSNGTRKALSKIHPTLSGPKLTERYGESWDTFAGRGIELSPPVSPAREEQLTVEKLVRKIQAHHAVWTLDIARRHARPYPNGEEIVESLRRSPQVLDLENGGQFTTIYIRDLEKAVFDDCQALRDRESYGVPVSTTLDLGPDHRRLVDSATRRAGLFLIQGPPGSGKTMAAQAIVDSYQAAGYEVVGASVTGKAAQGLREATTIDVRTIASWKTTWREAGKPARPSLILVDEASMLSLEDLHVLTKRAKLAKSKLVLMGDRLQLPPVGAGDPFRRLQMDHGAFELTAIHRQQVQWQCWATESLVAGGMLLASPEPGEREAGRLKIEQAVQAYYEQDRVHFLENPEQALAALAMHWWEATHEQPDRSTIMMAYRNDDVAILNDHVRALRRDRGELGESVAIFNKDFAAGDRILFRRNEYRAIRKLERSADGSLEPGESVPVYNGSLGKVTDVTPERIHVRLDSGSEIAFDPREYADIDYGYAVSIHKAQGITVDRAFVMVDRQVQGNAFLVAASRHRRDLQIYVPQSRVENLEALRDLATTFMPPDLIRDTVDVEIRSGGGPSGPQGGSWESEVLDLMKAFARYRDVPPPLDQLKQAEARIDRLREMIRPGPATDLSIPKVLGTPTRLVDLARLTEKLDVYIRRHVATAAVEASVHGLDERFTRAVAGYRGLAEPRFLPVPDPISKEEGCRHHLPRNLPEPLARNIRKLEDFAHTYGEATSHLELVPVELRPEDRVPSDAELAQLDDRSDDGVAELVRRLRAHRAVWTMDQARREAWRMPNREDVLEQLERYPRVVPLEDGHFTTIDMLQLEESVFQDCESLARSSGHSVSRWTDPDLAPEHLRLLEAATGEEGLFLIQGPPGSGKTTAARAVVESYREAGYEVLGASVTGKAAQGLREVTDLEVRTVASWKEEWARSGEAVQLEEDRDPCLILVDEAGVLSLDDLKVLTTRAEAVDAKLILMGDRLQLSPVGAGQPFYRLQEDHGAFILEEMHRQRVDWMRDATRALVEGGMLLESGTLLDGRQPEHQQAGRLKIKEAIDAYRDAGRIHFQPSREQTLTTLARHWSRSRRARPDHSSLMTAFRNRDVAALNAHARALLKKQGELTEAISIFNKEYAPGDRILFRKNEYSKVTLVEAAERNATAQPGDTFPVYNGTLGEIVDVSPEHMQVRLDSGAVVAFNPREYSDIDYGYAVSIYKAQGVTVDDAFFLADDQVDGKAFLVAASRHRASLNIYVPMDPVKGLPALEERASTFKTPDLIREVSAGGGTTRHMTFPTPETEEEALHIHWWNRARYAENRLAEAVDVANVHALALEYLEKPEDLTPQQLTAWTDKAAETARRIETLTFLPAEPREAVAALEKQLEAGISERAEGDLPETLRAAALLHRLDSLQVEMSEISGKILANEREVGDLGERLKRLDRNLRPELLRELAHVFETPQKAFDIIFEHRLGDQVLRDLKADPSRISPLRPVDLQSQPPSVQAPFDEHRATRKAAYELSTRVFAFDPAPTWARLHSTLEKEGADAAEQLLRSGALGYRKPRTEPLVDELAATLRKFEESKIQLDAAIDTADRASGGTLADLVGKFQADRAALFARIEERRDLSARFERISQIVDGLPSRRKIMQNMAKTGLRLPPEERADLPQQVRTALSIVEGEIRASEAKSLAQYRRTLSQIGKIAGHLALRQVGQTLMPRQLHRVVGMLNAVQGLRREGPRYLVHRLTPSPIKTAMSIMKTLQATPTEGRSPGRVPTQSRTRGYER